MVKAVFVFMVFAGAQGAVAQTSPGSIFEQFVRANKGEIPWPPADLVAKFEAYQMQVSGKNTKNQTKLVMVPSGRSLQAGCTDVSAPRALYATRVNSGATFLGFSEKCGVAEVISRDPQTGRNDFLLIENYGPAQKAHVRKA